MPLATPWVSMAMKLRHPHLFGLGLLALLQLLAVGLLAMSLQLQAPGEDWDGSGFAIYPPGTPRHAAFAEIIAAGAAPSGPLLGGLAQGFLGRDPATVERLRGGDAWLVAVSNPFGALQVGCGIAPLPPQRPRLQYP